MLERMCAIFREAVHALLKHPLRALLSALTCAVAIAVTVNVISLTFGLDEDMQRDVGTFGRRTIDIGRLPVFGRPDVPAVISPDDIKRIRATLKGLDPQLVPRHQFAAPMRASIDGVLPADIEQAALQALVMVPRAYQETLDVRMVAGRWYRDDELDACVLDRALAETLGLPPTPKLAQGGTYGRIHAFVDREIRTYRVVGILDDPMTYRALFEEFDWGRNARSLSSSLLSFRNAYVSPPESASMDISALSIVFPTVDACRAAAPRIRALYPANFENIFEMIGKGELMGHFVRADWMDALGNTSQQGMMIGNLVWVVIVLVAAIMIATLNMVGIRERYSELAIRRVEGARRRDVATQVLYENVLVSLAGGLIGLPLGYAGAAILSRIVGFPFRFEPLYAWMATGIAVLLGVLASVWPAYHAASVDPARVLARRLR